MKYSTGRRGMRRALFSTYSQSQAQTAYENPSFTKNQERNSLNHKIAKERNARQNEILQLGSATTYRSERVDHKMPVKLKQFLQ